MTNFEIIEWFKNLNPTSRSYWIKAEFPKWNPENWYQMTSWQIRQIKNKIDQQ